MRRLLPLLIPALALALAAALIGERPAQERLSEAAALLQQRVDRAADQLAASAAAALEADSLHMDAGHALGEGGMRLYRAGSVAAWTDHAPITDAVLDTLRAGHITQTACTRTEDGHSHLYQIGRPCVPGVRGDRE